MSVVDEIDALGVIGVLENVVPYGPPVSNWPYLISESDYFFRLTGIDSAALEKASADTVVVRFDSEIPKAPMIFRGPLGASGLSDLLIDVDRHDTYWTLRSYLRDIVDRYNQCVFHRFCSEPDLLKPPISSYTQRRIGGFTVDTVGGPIFIEVEFKPRGWEQIAIRFYPNSN